MNEGGSLGEDCLVGMYGILHTTPFLSGRERLLYHVRVAGSLSAALAGLCVVLCDLLKRFGS